MSGGLRKAALLDAGMEDGNRRVHCDGDILRHEGYDLLAAGYVWLKGVDDCHGSIFDGRGSRATKMAAA